MKLPDDRALRALLPALAVASVGQGAAFWQGIVNVETARDRLFPNFTETLLRGLATPRQMLAALPPGQERPFFERVRLQFSLPARFQVRKRRGSRAARSCANGNITNSSKPPSNNGPKR